MVSGLAVVFLSVTRTYLVSAVFQCAPLMFGFSRFNRRIALSLVLFCILVGVAGTLGSDSLNRWTQRIVEGKTTAGEDYTLYTRESEWKFMYNSVLSSNKALLFGHGFAAETTWYFPPELGGGASHSLGYGHNQNLSLLFIGGIVGSGLLFIVQVFQTIQSLLVMLRIAIDRRFVGDSVFLIFWGASIIVGVTVVTFLSSVISTRGGALWYGVGVGLFLGTRARMLMEASLTASENREAAPLSRYAALSRGRSGLSVEGVTCPTGQAVGDVRLSSSKSLPPAVQRRRRILLELEETSEKR